MVTCFMDASSFVVVFHAARVKRSVRPCTGDVGRIIHNGSRSHTHKRVGKKPSHQSPVAKAMDGMLRC